MLLFFYYILMSIREENAMKAFLLMITILFSSITVLAQEVEQFAEIPFGASRDQVIEEIMLLGYDPYDQVGSASRRVIIPVYMLAELPVQVDFLFNQNEKFYAFEIRTGRVEYSRLNKVFEAAAYMSNHFTLKYGKASKNPSLTETAIKPNLHNIYQEWFGIKTLDIYTAIIQKDGRFYTIGSVTQRNLAKESSKKNLRSEAKVPVSPAF